MKKGFFLSLVLLLFAVLAQAQPERVAFGLAFGQKIRFNNGDSGNPGINIQTWIPLEKSRKLYLVPGVTGFNPGETYKTSHRVYNYRFHGDLDFHYQLYHEKTLKLIAVAGVNYSYLSSTNEIYVTPPIMPVDSTLSGFGPSIGASLEMRMQSFWDFMVTAKYSAPGFNPADFSSVDLFHSPLSGVILQVHAVYFFRSRGKGYR